MNEFIITLISTLSPVIASIITGLITWGLYELAKFVRSRTKNELAANAVTVIGNMVEIIVKDLAQTMVPELQKAAADGRISETDKNRLKQTAIARIKMQIPAKITKHAKMAVNSVDELIQSQIEKNVLEIKAKKASGS